MLFESTSAWTKVQEKVPLCTHHLPCPPCPFRTPHHPRPHPHLQQNYTGHETTPCWNIEFWSFLSKTKRVWLFASHVHGEFFLCALQLALWNFLPFFGWRLEPLCDHTFGAGLNLTCPSFWGLNSDDFPFFTSSPGPPEPELAPFEKLQEIGNIWEISRKSVKYQWEIIGSQRLLESYFSNVANFL